MLSVSFSCAPWRALNVNEELSKRAERLAVQPSTAWRPKPALGETGGPLWAVIKTKTNKKNLRLFNNFVYFARLHKLRVQMFFATIHC